MEEKIVQRFLINNDCYKAGKLLQVKGLMLHSVGCPQPSATVFISSWDQPGVKSCVHGFIDANSGRVYSHRERYRRGIATNHGDPEHLWHHFGLTMDGFRSAVWEAMEEEVELPEQLSFQIKVTVDRLNIRTGPGTNYPVAGQIKDHGIYTIIQKSNDWGKLRSGAGWISLAYTERI